MPKKLAFTISKDPVVVVLLYYIYPSLLTAKMRPVLAQVRPAGHIWPTSSCPGVPRCARVLHPPGSPTKITSNWGWKSTCRWPRLSRERRIAFSIYRLAWSWNPRNGWTIIGFYSEIITVLQRYWWTHSCSLQVRKILFFENVSNNDLLLIFPPIPWFSNVRSHNAIKLIYKTSHRRKRSKENYFFKPSFFHPTGN